MSGPSLAWLSPAASMLSEEQLQSIGAPAPTMTGAFDVPPPPDPPPLVAGNFPGAMTYGAKSGLPGALSYSAPPAVSSVAAPPAQPASYDAPPTPDAMASLLGPGEAPPAADPLAGRPSLTTPAPRPPQPEAPAPDVQFQAMGGGRVPAHEAPIRGPEQNAHLMAQYDAPMQAADQIQGRSQWLAEEERNAMEIQAGKAMERQEAAQRVALQRQAEMERRAMDYEDQVQKMGQMHIDSNRWWSSKSTGDKITTGVLAFLGGLGALDPRGNGQNLAWEAIKRDMDADVEAQKFDYMVQQDQMRGAQNAFAIAMDRYQNEDAATAAARAAAIDYTAAKVGQLQAQWKGVEAANAADDLRARLAMERERTIAAGIQFVPARSAPGRYQMMVRGQMAPGTFSEKEAQQVFMEHGVKPQEKYDEQAMGIGGQMAIKGMENAGKGQDKTVEGAKDIAHQMQTAGVPKMRALTQAALAAMADDEGGKGEAATRGLVRGLVPFVGESAANAIMSDKANAREQAFQAFANLNMNQLSGGAISPSEEGRLKAQLGSTSDPSARRRALASVMQQLDAAEANIKAPYAGTGAAEQYERGAGKKKPAGIPKSFEFKGR